MSTVSIIADIAWSKKNWAATIPSYWSCSADIRDHGWRMRIGNSGSLHAGGSPTGENRFWS